MKKTPFGLQMATHKDWFRVTRNEDTTDEADVYIYDVIDSWYGVSANEFVQAVSALDVTQLNVYINSPGGSVWDGIAMLNALRRHKANVTVYVDGIAASAASFIAMAGDEVVMGPNSELMIHDAWGLCVGNAADMDDMRDRLDKISGNLASIYASRAGGNPTDWRNAMLAETWYSAEEAVSAGLADRIADTLPTKITEDEDAQDRFDLSIFAHAGRRDAPKPKIPARGPRPDAHRAFDALAVAAGLQTTPALGAVQATDAGAPKPPAEPAEPTHPLNESEDAMSEKIINGLRERLGIKADAQIDEDGLLGALDEALDERAEAPTQNGEPAPGTVTLDEETYQSLRADADAGRQARDQQIGAERQATVQAAIDSGRIPPARREHWVNLLAADPGAEEVLNGLQPGTVPLAPAGYTGGVDEATDEDRNYSKFWPSNTTEED
ncbi:MAG: ATP-dependent Clp protease proteolytic subunit [Micrococcus sp.]|nr:ATP-dependent Clp protease proteolytic subunit [Micrococcus sp.]